MALMFTATPSLKKAVSLINDLDSAKFPLLLSRILQKLHSKDERAFSEEEEERLQSAFKLENKDLTLVLESSEFFLQQAAYHSAKPAVLGKQLQQLELEEDKVQTFTDVWVNLGKDVIEKLRQRSMAPRQLQDVNWQLRLQMAQANQAKLKTPVAVFEFNVKDETKSEDEKVHVEFDHKELYEFYNKLEAIQSQLDSLS